MTGFASDLLYESPKPTQVQEGWFLGSRRGGSRDINGSHPGQGGGGCGILPIEVNPSKEWRGEVRVIRVVGGA